MTPFRLESLPIGLVRAELFRAALGVSESGLCALIERGRIPKPIRLHGRCDWRTEDVAFHVGQRRRRHS